MMTDVSSDLNSLKGSKTQVAEFVIIYPFEIYWNLYLRYSLYRRGVGIVYILEKCLHSITLLVSLLKLKGITINLFINSHLKQNTVDVL